MARQRHPRHLHHFLGIALAFPAILSIPANAQVIEWARTLGTTGTDNGRAVATAPNAVYIAGTVTNGAFPGFTYAGNTDAFVSKFDTSGSPQWTRQFGTAQRETAFGVAADASGVYVVGETAGALTGTNAGGGDVFVRKYDASGNELWTRQFGLATDDQASSAAVDATGLYVIGYIVGALPGQTAAGGPDGFVRKYDFGGNELWTRQFGTGDTDKPWGIATYSGGIYVTGDTNGALGTQVGGRDLFVRKYDAAGNAQWTRQFGTSTTDGGDGGAIAVDSSGVYVAGHTSGTFTGQTKIGGLWDAFVQKLDLNGNPVWVRQFGTTGEEGGYGIALGGNYVYAAGQAGSGAFLWRFDYNGVDSGNIQRGTFATLAYGAASDSTGAYVVGSYYNDIFGGMPPVGDKDAFLFKVPHPPSINGITDGFTFQPGVAPTTWIAIFGSALSSSTRTWESAISGTQLPTSLDEVSVSINGRPATVFFISSGQVNVLGPLDDATGPVQVTLTNRYGTSPPVQVTKQNYLPAFYAPFATAAGLHATVVGLDGAYIGKVGTDPRVTRAALPGEIVQVFATGFGPTTPPAPSDKIVAGIPEVVNRPKITIGGKEVTFFGNGNLVLAGLYQFNVMIPADLADGDHPFIAEVAGVSSSPTVFLAVKK